MINIISSYEMIKNSFQNKVFFLQKSYFLWPITEICMKLGFFFLRRLRLKPQQCLEIWLLQCSKWCFSFSGSCHTKIIERRNNIWLTDRLRKWRKLFLTTIEQIIDCHWHPYFQFKIWFFLFKNIWKWILKSPSFNSNHLGWILTMRQL